MFEEKTGMKKQLVVFGLIILLIGIALSGCVNENKKTMGYTKMMSDIKTLPPTDLFTLQSYNDGEVITIEGTVYNVSYYEASESQKYTIVTFGNSTSLEGYPLCIVGDKRSEYRVGNAVSIPVHVKDYDINGTAVTWLEEWYTFYLLTKGNGSSNSKTMTYTELMYDVKSLPPTSLITLQSYQDGQVLYIEDTVFNVSYFEASESQQYTFVSFGNSSSLIGFPLCFVGDKRNEYHAGSFASIPVHVKDYNINGTAVTWLEEWYTFYLLQNPI
jgi:hypothetical protein